MSTNPTTNTNPNAPRHWKRWLGERLQTRLYPYLLASAGAQLNAGRDLALEKIEMIVWAGTIMGPSARYADILLPLQDTTLETSYINTGGYGGFANYTYLDSKILQSIWYQINSGQEIYVVGVIQDDGTVRGGTGWGAELAKLCAKPLYVFDQAKACWFQWDGDTWAPRTGADEPVIRHAHFTGTGTRFLEPAGRDAIAALFARSF